MSNPNNNNSNQASNSASLYEFVSIPSYLTLAPPSLTASQSSPMQNENSLNSLEFPTMRGLRMDNNAGGVTLLDHSFNANHSYWSDNYAAINHQSQSKNKKNELSLSSNLALSTPTLTTIVTNTLKAEPAYIEKYTSFYSDALLSEIVSSIESALLCHSVDFSFTKEKSKFQCVAYDCFNNAVQFLIKIYQAKQGGENNKLVEFQRRFGCSLAYNKAYQSLFKSIDLPKKTPFMQQTQTLQINNNDLNNILPTPQPTIDSIALQSLCSMAISSDLCSARESLKCLSTCNLNVVSQNENNNTIIVSTIVNVMNKNIKDDEQERLSSQLLVNLANISPSSHPIIIESLLSQLLNCLDSPITKSSTTSSTGCLQSRCTKRYLAKLFNLLASSQAKLLEAKFNTNEEYLNILNKYEFVIDSQVSDNIKSAINKIENA